MKRPTQRQSFSKLQSSHWQPLAGHRSWPQASTHKLNSNPTTCRSIRSFVRPTEPAQSFTFNVSRAANQMYNLTCHAGPTFPRPSLALFRYRAGPLEAVQPAAQHQQQALFDRHANRPRLAATQLRQEPLPGTQTQLTISAPVRHHRPLLPPVDDLGVSSSQAMELLSPTASGPATTTLDDAREGPPDEELQFGNLAAASGQTTNDIITTTSNGGITSANSQNSRGEPINHHHRHHRHQQPQPTTAYEISAWVLVEESSLSSNLVSQFECLLTLEDAHYEQRQSLALQKGWHVNSSALTARSTLVGLFSALAALLCLTLAIVSSMVIFKLLHRHANQKRVHQARDSPLNPGSSGGGGSSITGTNQSLVGKTNFAACESSHSTASTSTNEYGGDHQTRENHLQEEEGPEVAAESTSESHLGPKLTGLLAPTLNGVTGHSRRLASLGQPQQHYASYAQPHQAQTASLYNANSGNSSNNNHRQATTDHSDGVYRVPPGASSQSGTRFVIGGSGQQNWSYGATAAQLQQHAAANNRNHQPSLRHAIANQVNGGGGGSGQATISVNGKALYC